MPPDATERAQRIMALVEAADTDWDGVEREVEAAVQAGLIRDAWPRIERTEVQVLGHCSDGVTRYYTVRLNTDTDMLEAVDAAGTVQASAVTLEGVTSQLWWLRVDPNPGE